MPKFKVNHRYASGWADADWHEDGKPWLFDTVADAESEIDSFIKETQEAAKEGAMEDAYLREDYSVVQVNR